MMLAQRTTQPNNSASERLPTTLLPNSTSGMEAANQIQSHSPEDYESSLQNGLSLLASLDDLAKEYAVNEEIEISNWLWEVLTPDSSTDSADKTTSHSALASEWKTKIDALVPILPKISPFQVHTIATQSSIFTDGSQAHWVLCLLLCAHSLQRCPSPIETRWKRWQSIVCETIRFFQSYGIETNCHGVSLWVKHIIPACQHVLKQLPKEALHVGLVSSLVGTTSRILRREGEDLSDKNVQVLISNAHQLLHALRDVVYDYGETEDWVWLNPWRSYSEAKALAIGDENEDQELIRNENNIAWWNRAAHRHEKVAGMETTWDEWGISVLAMMAVDDRPLVYTPEYTWKVWFPHVSILFKAPEEGRLLADLPFLHLEKLLKSIPEKSLPAVTSAVATRVDAPYETFQLLSNCLMAKPQKKGHKKASKQAELESKAKTDRIVGLMKSLLSRYSSVNQVKIVRKLVHDCPHPGLRAKFMDLLRPVIFDEDCADALWSYIGSFIKNLLLHMDADGKDLLNIDDLIEKVEVHVAAVTMIQLWCMVKGRLHSRRIKGRPLGKFYKVLKGKIETWMLSTQSMPRDDYYRLYLLEGALSHLLRILSDARKKTKGDDDESLSSSSSLGQEATPEVEESPKPKAQEEAVVGDIDIFG